MWQEARVALRMLLRTPLITVPAVVVLTLGIGMAAALYAVVYSTWLAPLPYHAPGRLVSVLTRFPSYKLDALLSSDYGEWQGTRSLGPLAAYSVGKTAWIGSDETLELGEASISGNLLSVLGVRAALGRGIEALDDAPGAARVAMLSDGLWRERFGAARSVPGSRMNLEGVEYTIIGVLPAGFRMPEQNRVDVWVPLALTEDRLHHGGGRATPLHGGVARLQTDATPGTALAEMTTRLAASRAEDPGLYLDNVSMRVAPLAEYAGGNVRLAALVLAGAAGAILLIACTNVASLLMARAAGRDREMAVRMALGASPWRIARLLLFEGLLLGAAGIVGGLSLAASLVRIVESLRPAAIYRALPARLSGGVLAVAIPVLLVCSLAFSLAPALPLPRLRLRRALVVAELALSLVLLVGASLLLESLARLRAVSPGFQTEGLVAASVSAPDNSLELRRELRQRMERAPGVLAVSFTGPLPPTEYSRASAFSRADRVPDPSWNKEIVVVRLVDDQYFRAMGVPLLEGRLFTAGDLGDETPVAVVNRTFASRYFAGESVVGKQVDGMPWKTVIGVAADTRNDGLRNPVRPEIDLPFTARFQAQGGGITTRNGLKVLIRSSGDPAVAARELVRGLRQIDPRLVANTRVMEEQWDAPRTALKFQSSVFAAFAVLALVMASVGIYGVLAHVVVLRYREIGVRLALGARPGDIQALVVREALLLAGGGIVLGLGGAWAASRLLASLALWSQAP